MKIRRLLIIPAKSSSQRIKNKNFKNFCGKPMIRYPYDSAVKSKLFDKIHISTESKIIKKKLLKQGIEIDFLRPKKLTKKNVGLFEVYKYVLQKFNKKNFVFDEVWALLPCTPLIDHKDLIRLRKNIENKKLNKPIISVCKYNAPIEWALTLNKKNKMIQKKKKKQMLPSQNFIQAYYDVGSIAVFDAKNLDTISNFYKGYFHGFELPLEKNVDIDDKHDWNFAKFLKNIK